MTATEEDRYVQLQSLALDYAREGDTKGLEKMLRYGMPINLGTHKGDTLLMLATYNGCVDTTSILIQKGANIDQKNQRGQTPLEGACFKGKLPIVKLLVENGATIDKNAIIYASIFGHKDIVYYLTKQGVDGSRSKVFGVFIDIVVAISFKIKTLFKTKDTI
ncbi:MAG: ankyrin repeat domain-containing protein [Sulfurovum sp.]|nr:ankyrin repeat domain-containing protein [Sulfurovum sp.]